MGEFWTFFGRGIYTMMHMDETPSRPQHLFVVRMWAETVGPTPAQWRGSVEHISTGQKFYFTSMADMADFINLRLKASTEAMLKGKLSA